MKDELGGWLILVGFLVLVFTVPYMAYRNGHEDGAIAHHKGEVVVVELPDGSLVVVKPKAKAVTP